MKKTIIISLFIIFIAVSVFAFLKFNNSSNINSAMNDFYAGNYTEAYNKLLPLAKAGNGIAQNNIGLLYDKGLGIKQDYKKAFFWYEKSTKQGYSTAMSNLATLYQNGNGVKRNINIAIKLYEKATEQDNPLALNNLGYIYIWRSC